MSVVKQINIDKIKVHLNHLYKARYLPWAITAFFILFIILSLWQIWQTGENSQKTNPPIAMTPTIHIERLSNIANFHLFGIYDASLQNLPETQLQLTLEGTLVNSTANNLSYAIIAAPGQMAKIYKITQIVPGGAVIRRILKDRIILENHGSLGVLRLPVSKTTMPRML